MDDQTFIANETLPALVGEEETTHDTGSPTAGTDTEGSSTTWRNLGLGVLLGGVIIGLVVWGNRSASLADSPEKPAKASNDEQP